LAWNDTASELLFMNYGYASDALMPLAPAEEPYRTPVHREDITARVVQSLDRVAEARASRIREQGPARWRSVIEEIRRPAWQHALCHARGRAAGLSLRRPPGAVIR